MKVRRFVSTLVLVAATGAAGTPPDRAGAQDAPASASPSRIRDALERYRREPAIDALVDEALAAPLLDPGRARDAAERARWSGLLPQTRAEVRRGQALDLSTLQPGGSSGERTGWSSGDELAFSASMTFRLDRLLFASEEPGILRERRQLEERRLELVTQLVRIYFERRRLQIERDLSGSADPSAEIRILESEALLDVFTNGAFTRMMVRAGLRAEIVSAETQRGNAE